MDLSEPIELLQWLQKIQSWLKKILMARRNIYVLTIAQKLQIIRRLVRGRSWLQVTPSYEVCHKRSETDFRKSKCWNFYNSTWSLQKILSEAAHCWRQSFHPWRHCWKSSSVRSCSISVTALQMLPIISKWCTRGWFLIVGKKKIHMGTDMGNAVAAEPLQCSSKSKTPSQTIHCDRAYCHDTEAKRQQCLFECTLFIAVQALLNRSGYQFNLEAWAFCVPVLVKNIYIYIYIFVVE